MCVCVCVCVCVCWGGVEDGNLQRGSWKFSGYFERHFARTPTSSKEIALCVCVCVCVCDGEGCSVYVKLFSAYTHTHIHTHTRTHISRTHACKVTPMKESKSRPRCGNMNGSIVQAFISIACWLDCRMDQKPCRITEVDLSRLDVVLSSRFV